MADTTAHQYNSQPITSANPSSVPSGNNNNNDNHNNSNTNSSTSSKITVATTTSATATTLQPIDIPNSSSSPIATSPQAISPYCKRTGTRSTFCPNTLHKGTKLTEDDYDYHEQNQHSHDKATGWLSRLGLRKNANLGDSLIKQSEPHEQSYY
ncbi:hypothetical protein FBU30_009119 [Linnemannia zychae]|nr:hypothetical protein FBU30_009119 [Linnemannia zychae]